MGPWDAAIENLLFSSVPYLINHYGQISQVYEFILQKGHVSSKRCDLFRFSKYLNLKVHYVCYFYQVLLMARQAQ